MSYLNIISLEDAKAYLKVEDTASDGEITRMVKASLSFIEKETNHIFYAREKQYDIENGCALIYDYPLNSIPEGASQKRKSLYSIVFSNEDLITVNVGYTGINEIPQELIETAYQILKVWFYESEKQSNSSLLPISVKEAINVNRRFIL